MNVTLCCRHTQQWTALRAQGVQTPQIAAWQRLPDLPAATYANSDPASSIYSYLLNVYNVAGFQDVRRSVWRHTSSCDVCPGCDRASLVQLWRASLGRCPISMTTSPA